MMIRKEKNGPSGGTRSTVSRVSGLTPRTGLIRPAVCHQILPYLRGQSLLAVQSPRRKHETSKKILDDPESCRDQADFGPANVVVNIAQ
jgi:hypothetical protein